MPEPTAITLGRKDWLWLVGIWALVAATLLWRSVHGSAGAPLFLDTDDAMRMVVVRDFLDGQGWNDLVQHRLNTPFGAEIHWSRLVDLPLAGLLWLARQFTDFRQAEWVAGMVWPLVLLGALLWLSARATLELVGRAGLLPGLVLPILSPAILAEFSPGRVDHHNVIIVLTMATLLASLVALRRSGAAWFAGICAALALSVALEAVPVMLAAILAFGLCYVADPARAGNLMRFGLGLGGGLTVLLMLVRPPDRWLEAACDMISPVYVLAGVLVGLVFVVVSLLPAPRRAWQRLVLLAGLGIAAGAAVILAYPQCLGGPYASLDPWLEENWIGAIIEAKPWHASLPELPAYAITVGAPVFLGLIAAALAFRRTPEKRLGWLTLLVFLVLTTLVMLAQIRGARLAILPTIPAAAWLIAVTQQRYLAQRKLLPGLALAAAWLMFSGIMLSIVVSNVVNLLPDGRAQLVSATRASKQPCLAGDAFADLRGMPPERVMTPIDLGAHLLLETPHGVVAAPYHRNEQGVLDAFRFFNQPVSEARKIATNRGLGLLVTCPAMPEMQGTGLGEPNTILSLLAAGRPPDWLEDVSLEGPLKIYAILPEEREQSASN
ncbi:hypothetical protein GGR20_002771 [Devosia subaequoris]|uniref:AcrB/AcrD/AcrF family protein n=1 Tax=Devosia subaequoris TaxID=395930 RepID=A0A7W6IP31_9HYPH|nr:hypothetical protein [Devosia subaequoris]MBB4053115.1 hypothetical protein [Devosia subaequoris]MCP1210530.1 hypothetical protein [Devosia subaequoris]